MNKAIIAATAAAMVTALATGAMTPNEMKSLAARMEPMTTAEADSLAASLLTSPEELTEVTGVARDVLFDPESPDFNERIYGSFARAAASSPHASMTQQALAEWEAYAVGLNAPGTPATDFKVKQLSGEQSTMRALTAGKPVMLYFYNPDCRHCAETMKRLRGHAMPAPVYAICIDATEKRWRDTSDALPQEWTALLDMSDVQSEELYIFLSTPAIYLLDADGNVTAKNPPVNTLINPQP